MVARPVVLADANSFFASCETVFHPGLQGRPVVVLSNNDGCVVARSPQAKRLGIANGVPWFTIRSQAEQDGVVARSSNYELYASLSARMMSIMRTFLPNQEIYSIDECFLDALPSSSQTLQACRSMRDSVLKGIGIPISVGVAHTKTLAKISNHWAKSHVSAHGITRWDDIARDQGKNVLTEVPIDEVWGVGRRLSRRLQALGMVNAWDLHEADPASIRHRFSVQLERTVLELRGIPCVEAGDDASQGRRTTQILCSRMFSHPVTGWEMMGQALSVYAQKACRRLRNQGSLCAQVSAFCSTSPHDDEHEYVTLHGTTQLSNPCDDPLTIAKAACDALRERFDGHARFVRAGVLLLSLVDAAQFHTLEGLDARRDTHGLGEVLDDAARRFGPARVGIGYGGIRGHDRGNEDTGAQWTMRREMLSSRSTTRWDEMAVVHAV